MDIKKVISQLEEQIKDRFAGESSGHDIYHLRRTLNLALQIQGQEGGDRVVVAVAAFLHDIHRIIEKETGKFCPPRDSLSEVGKLLSSLTLTPEQEKGVLMSIEHHEEYDFSETGKTAQDIETLILQDADNLDAMGAVGIARTFSYNGAHGMPMWIPDKPLDRAIYDESEPDPSAIHHFYGKLLKLKDNINTETGKQLAVHRHRFMEKFLEEFFREWQGEV